ncbi:hypothetical protein M409DRAFT_53706 [Zasmidium cellare ATCC 36951]|uniref:Uncharacterized protein n=1 Tax=Zasmidium cellare ATCC 36951 TaxID=1080233 RepID=A0A6A6CPC7_ZASCE|nr:uncharacterized protein M409DRAFT_53706 [Zasmidium cellare ATCC 36951]KAF2167732.1 hypothetical protein M409DRAFT_53706 [Zasmidium cellare ATCC 36951]
MASNLMPAANADRPRVLRSKFQFIPTPLITVGHLRIPINDSDAPVPAVKPASLIFPTQAPQTPKTWDDPSVAKGVNLLFFLNGRVDDNDLRLLTGQLPNVNFRAVKSGYFTRYRSNLQNTMWGTGASSWLMCFISSEAQLENMKVHTFNLWREGHLLKIRTAHQTDADYAEACAQATECHKLATRLVANALAMYTNEIVALRSEGKSPFRFKERRSNATLRKTFVEEECTRLHAVVDELTDWPQKEFELPAAGVTSEDQLPEERLAIGMRSPTLRSAFWRSKATRKVINSYCRAHAAHIQIGQMNSTTSPRWARKIIIQFAFNCDVAYFFIIMPRLETERLKHVENRHLRINATFETQDVGYLAHMKNFTQVYVAHGYDAGLGLPTMDEILVESEDTMGTAGDGA